MRINSSFTLLALAWCAACMSGSSASPHIERFRGEAVVTSGAETCRVGLLVAGQRYQPVQLPAELAIIGKHLWIDGTITQANSTCMIGPLLTVSSATPID